MINKFKYWLNTLNDPIIIIAIGWVIAIILCFAWVINS